MGYLYNNRTDIACSLVKMGTRAGYIDCVNYNFLFFRTAINTWSA